MLKAVAALAIPVAMFGAVASTSFLVVDVREGGPDGMRIVLPVPLILAQAAASFVPESKTRVDIPDIEEYLPAAEKMIVALRDVPDAELVRVEERDELVIVSKVGDVLEVRVESSHENVAVNVPLEAVEELLESAEGGSIDVRDAIATLRGLSRTNLVEVHNGDEHVKVWIW